VHALDDGATAPSTKQQTNGDGVDFMISALRSAHASTMLDSCRPFGAAAAPSRSAGRARARRHWLMDEQISSSAELVSRPRRAGDG
jgi:hypothetical protein